MKGTFNDGTTESWVKYLANTIENDNNALKITYVDDDRGAYVFLSNTHDLNTDLTIGDEYKVVGLVKVNTGSVTLEANGQSGGTIDTVNITSTDWIEFELNFTAGNATTCLLRLDNLSAGEIIWIDRYELFHKTTQTGNNRATDGGEENEIGANVSPWVNASWVKGTGWTVTDNEKAACDGTQVADSDLDRGAVIAASQDYEVVVRLNNVTAGTLTPVCGTQAGTARSADGTYTETITSNGTNFILRANSTFVGDVEVVSAKPIILGEFFEPDALGSNPVIIQTDYFAENPSRYLTRYFNAQNWKDLILLAADNDLNYTDHIKLMKYTKNN